MDIHRKHGLALTILGVLGFLASFILVLERLAVYEDANHKSACDINDLFSCTSVTQTWQASLFGFPNPLIGIAAFMIAITLGVVLLSGVRLPKWIHLGFLTGISLGFVFIVWLISQAVFEIGLLCIYCMVVWTVTTLLLSSTIKHGLVTGHLLPRADETRRVLIADWMWVGAAVTLVVIAALVVFVLFL